jgi:hypothetical protein
MTNSFRGGLLLMPISQGGSATPRAMLIRRRRRYNFNIEQETARSPQAAEQGWSPVFLNFSGTRAFPGKKPRHHPHSRSTEMCKRGNRADSDLLFVSADDLEHNPEDENEPRRQPNPAKVIKVAPQETDFRLWKCQCIKCNHTGDSTTGTDSGNGGSRG